VKALKFLAKIIILPLMLCWLIAALLIGIFEFTTDDPQWEFWRNYNSAVLKFFYII